MKIYKFKCGCIYKTNVNMTHCPKHRCYEKNNNKNYVKLFSFLILFLFSFVYANATDKTFGSVVDGANVIGYSSTYAFASQSFKFTDDYCINSVTANLRVTGSPSDIRVRIETDSSGDPSGTLVNIDATKDIAKSSITTAPTFSDKTFTFNSCIPVLQNTKYHIVFTTSSGALSSDNYYEIGRDDNYVDYDASNQYVQYGNSALVWTSSGTNAGFDISIDYSTYSPPPTPTITTNNTNYYNTTSVSLQLNTTSNTNMSYYLDNSDLIISDGLVAYYQAETNAKDRMGNYDGTEYGGVTYDTGKYGQGFSFDGVDDVVGRSSLPYISLNKNFSISLWAKSDDANGMLIQNTVSSSNDRFAVGVRPTGAIEGGFHNGATYLSGFKSSSVMNTGNWVFITMIYEVGNHIRIYINNIYDYQSASNFGYDTDLTFGIGARGDGSASFFNGSIDEVRIYNRALNSSEISNLYYSSPYSTICEDCNNSVLTLNSLSETNHSLTLMSQTSTGTEYTFEWLVADYTAPTITNNIEAEINNYLFNGSKFSCSDTYLTSCNISIGGFNKAAGQNFTLTYNGNVSYNITAIDLAGNIATETGVLFVNPYQYFRFYDNLRSTYITNYYIDGVLYTNYYNPKLYDLGLGSNTVEFTKEGYTSTNITLELNTTSSLNETYNITAVNVLIKAYDLDTSTALTFNLTLNNVSDTVSYTSISNLTKYYNETLTGTVTATFSSTNYATTQVIYTLTPTSSLTVNVYMLLTNSTSVHQFTVLAQDSGLALDNVLVEIQEIYNYTTVASKYTTANGKTYFYLDPTQEYKVIFNKDNYVTATANTIPTVTEYTVKLSSTSSAYSYVDDISYSFKPIESLLVTNETYTFSAFISGSSFTLTNVSMYLNNGTVIYSSSNSNPSGTTYSYDYTLPYMVNISSITIKLSYILNGDVNTITREYDVVTFTNTSFVAALTDYGKDTSDEAMLWKWFILMFATVGVLIFGTISGSSGASLLLIPVWSFAVLVNWISWVYAGVVIFISLVTFIGGRR